MAADYMLSTDSTCLCLWTNMQSWRHPNIVLWRCIGNWIESGRRPIKSWRRGSDALIDDADTVIDWDGTTFDVLWVGTESLTFGLKLLLTLIEPDWRGSNSTEVFLFWAAERCCLRIWCRSYAVLASAVVRSAFTNTDHGCTNHLLCADYERIPECLTHGWRIEE